MGRDVDDAGAAHFVFRPGPYRGKARRIGRPTQRSHQCGAADNRALRTPIHPARLACPAIEFISATDRIVPAASAAVLPESRTLRSGHVGMVVGGRARAELWEPLRDWLIAAAHPR